MIFNEPRRDSVANTTLISKDEGTAEEHAVEVLVRAKEGVSAWMSSLESPSQWRYWWDDEEPVVEKSVDAAASSDVILKLSEESEHSYVQRKPPYIDFAVDNRFEYKKNACLCGGMPL